MERFTDAQSLLVMHFNTNSYELVLFYTPTGTVIDYGSVAFANGMVQSGSITTTSVATAYAFRIALAEADGQ